MSNVKVVSRQSREDSENALTSLINKHKSEGKKVVKEGNAVFAIEKAASGLVIKSRIA